MDIAPQNYHELGGLADLKRLATSDKSEAIAPVARQFESLFLQMMLKSMRDTVPEGGLLDNGDTKFYEQMMDSQLAVSLAEGGGVGLAKIIERQLGGVETGANKDVDTRPHDKSGAAQAQALLTSMRTREADA